MSILDEVGDQLAGLNPLVLVSGHCLFVALLCRALRDKYLLSFWVGILAAVGGGVVSGYLLQDPKLAPNALLASNAIFATWAVCWWAINYFPKDLVAGLVSLLPVRAVCRACSNILRVGTMTARCDAATKIFPGSFTAPLIIGTIGGSGGKFLSDAILSGAGLSPGASELTVPTFAWRSGVLATTTYYLLAHVAETLSQKEAKALLSLVFIGHGILADVLGRPLDFTQPIARLLHGVLNVPVPGQKPATPISNQPNGKEDKKEQ